MCMFFNGIFIFVTLSVPYAIRIVNAAVFVRVGVILCLQVRFSTTLVIACNARTVAQVCKALGESAVPPTHFPA